MNIQGQRPPPEIQMLAAAAMLNDVLLHLGGSPCAATFYCFLARVAAELPEEFWATAMEAAAKPCGVVGCECEKIRGPLMQAIDAARKDYGRMVEVHQDPGEKGFAA